MIVDVNNCVVRSFTPSPSFVKGNEAHEERVKLDEFSTFILHLPSRRIVKKARFPSLRFVGRVDEANEGGSEVGEGIRRRKLRTAEWGRRANAGVGVFSPLRASARALANCRTNSGHGTSSSANRSNLTAPRGRARISK